MPEGHPQLAHVALACLDSEPASAVISEVSSEASWRVAWDEEFGQDGMVVVYSDGACRHNQRAGYGGFCAKSHAFNFSLPVLGWCQTDQRAELQAILTILETDARALLIKTDSEYVINGCAKKLFPFCVGMPLWQSYGLFSNFLTRF